MTHRLGLDVRRRDAQGDAVYQAELIDPVRTALVVVDWTGVSDCKTTNILARQYAPLLNETLVAARRLGMKVMLMPGSASKYYAGSLASNNALALPHHAPPPPPPWSDGCDPWPGWAPAGSYGGMPYYDLTRNGIAAYSANQICNCARTGHPVNPTDQAWDDYPCRSGAYIDWSGMPPEIAVDAGDYLSEDPQHLWNMVREHGIEHLVYAGAYTNVCLAFRYFGVWNLWHAGMNIIVVRDLTLPLVPVNFDPYLKPPVYDARFSREAGLEKILEFTERHGVAGTITRDQITGQAGRQHG